jgi:hypothetical protein
MAETLMKVTLNCTTGKEETRPLTAEEIEQLKIDQLNGEAWDKARVAEQVRISTLKESAKNKLITGEPLTEEEASLLVM